MYFKVEIHVIPVIPGTHPPILVPILTTQNYGAEGSMYRGGHRQHLNGSSGLRVSGLLASKAFVPHAAVPVDAVTAVAMSGRRAQASGTN